MRWGRVLAVYVLAGALLGGLSAWVQRRTGLPSTPLGGFLAGMLTLVAPLLNWLARSGKAGWPVPARQAGSCAANVDRTRLFF